MSSRRFFIRPEEIEHGFVRLTGDEAHHLRSVLRLAAGEEITLFDGTGNRFLARIDTISKTLVSATVISQGRSPLPKVRVELGQALLKGQKMELILQKITELGIDAIRPFFAEHGLQKIQTDSKIERWERIVLEACKQCDRAMPPRIHLPRKISELHNEIPPYDLKLFFWEQESRQTLDEVLAGQEGKISSALFLVGPEGGFSAAEAAEAQAKGFLPVSLGSRILRAETATIAASAILQFMLGNLSPQEK